MKENRFYLGVAAALFFLGISCSCNGKGVQLENEQKTELSVEKNDADSLKQSADTVAPFKDNEVISEWGNNVSVITVFGKDSKIFISEFTKETKKYVCTEVEEFQVDGMAGYRFKNNHAIEYLVDCGSMINYVKGEEKAVYEWIR